MSSWIMKTEPAEYSIEDLKKDQRTLWTGVRNYQARNYLRDEVKVGDLVLIYHSSTEKPGIYGEARVTRTGIPDPTQWDSKSKYFDPKSSPETPRWICVEVEFVRQWTKPLTLEEIKTMPELSQNRLVKKGNRLSIIPLTDQELKAFRRKLSEG